MPSDSSKPDFWDTRYRGGVTPWDAGGVPPGLVTWLKKQAPGQRVLVPGCGSGYEVQHFAEHGDEVLGIDFSEPALSRARQLALPARQADFFALDEPPFDVTASNITSDKESGIGAWSEPALFAKAYGRSVLAQPGVSVRTTKYDVGIGFRCARSP